MAFNLQSTLDDLFKPPSRLQSLVDRAVEPSRHGPDLALNLDICDLVNRKKGNYPHDAVFALLSYINGRSATQGLLALTLLDNLIKNCGHPVHYQVASREFLNELFRRFPEYQPATPNAVHRRILELLQEWQVTLCRRSRYREDLQRINDMYALLCRKGWRFPRIDSDNVAVVLEPEDTLKTREELEQEDMEAMQAKLQELLRRATPRDLREANKLMKIITGYEASSKQRDYDREWDDELQTLERKVRLLHEMLLGAQPGRALDDTAQELLSKCTSSHTRLKKVIAERTSSSADSDGDSEEARELARIIRLSDMIAAAERAATGLKHGRKPAPADLAAPAESGAPAQPAPGAPELISWEDPDDASSGQPRPDAAAAPAPASPLRELAGLSFHEATPAAAPPLSPALRTPGPPGSAAPARAQPRPMTNPSLPANAQQARLDKAPSSQKDAFDFSDLLAAAKSAGAQASAQPNTQAGASAKAAPNSSRTTSWGSSPDPGAAAKSNGGALIDFLS
ncbi:ARF-binding protein [Coemansia javaensis]|uniref:ARF-binding protein n=1 Tax=Coemansia javaensis TaxID=2761396 RepID=A0A9W8HMB6_9FUNG|nr:ARF-binding protein [Coemansia javaensis]